MERLLNTLKCEFYYLFNFNSDRVLKACINNFISTRYNFSRPHTFNNGISPSKKRAISTGETATASNDVDYNIYKKNFKANDKVTLGTNGQSARLVNYFVAVKSEEKIITNPIGDINGDGKINWDDYILLKIFIR